MSLWAGITSFFSGEGVMKTIEGVATEWIETDLEKAEAKTVFIKALDPNGAMRRQLSRDVTQLYKIYVVSALAMLALEFIVNLIGMNTSFVSGDALIAIADTTAKLTELFVPITSLFGVIVTASFGVNYANVRAESKK
ncbi:hypothetical protein [Pseudoalteromonas virus vB_PspP-H6/1]|nr:hypothetical protein [Pseudoalteromonas virus vB_PspP-H6/1]